MLEETFVTLCRPFAAILLLVLASSPCAGAEHYAHWLDEAFPADGPGATVILVRDGEVIYRDAAGWANVELGVAMTPGNVLRIASITKQVTAAAIMLLHDRGELDVNDGIRQHLPGYPEHGEPITIAHLLSHTSGVFNFTDIPGYWRGDLIRSDRSVDEMIELFADEPLQFAPGSDFRYSNSGYTLLGAIIERVSGQSYAEFVTGEIFEPLGMGDSQYGGRQVVRGRASGYQRGEDGEYFNALPISMTHAYAAGALLSTVDDLARWNAALMGGELLSEESLRAMTTAFRLDDGTATEYGFGLYVRERNGLRVIGHTGGIHGFSTSALWLPDERVYVAVLANLEDTGSANELAWRLARDAATCRPDCETATR